jgi:starch synthase
MKSSTQGTVATPSKTGGPAADERRGGRGVRGRSPEKPFAVVHLAAEYWPFAQAGGLAEAVRGLAEYQASTGRPVLVILPLYRAVRETSDLLPASELLQIQMGPGSEPARLYRLAEPPPGPRILFLDHPSYFDRPGIYGEDGADYPDNGQRFAFFCRAALELLPGVLPGPVVVHAHDWHAALAPVYLRAVLKGDPYFDSMGSVLTVHNGGFHGHFPPSLLAEVGLPMELYDWRHLEWYGRANWLKGGVQFADIVTTVSPTHARELCTAVGGFGLHEVFIGLKDRLVGILNGIDRDLWNPATDPQITARYSTTALSGKQKCKTATQRGFGLSQRARTPLFAISARLVAQKGLDLLVNGSTFFNHDAQYVILGDGEERFRVAFAELADQLPGRMAVEFGFTDRLEHRLLAGADLLLMPSLYEPCGLTQMRAMRYGVIPVARAVGGLADTITDGVNGFLFTLNTPEGLDLTVARAIKEYSDPARWREYVRAAMSTDFGWERSAEQYLETYRRAMAAHAGAR